MTDRFAVDTNAVVDLMRATSPTPPQLLVTADVFLPLPVFGELYVGALMTRRPKDHISALEQTAARWPMLIPQIATARIYAELRVAIGSTAVPSPSKVNDLWIAALCIEHELPLLTNDRGFDRLPRLTVLHW